MQAILKWLPGLIWLLLALPQAVLPAAPRSSSIVIGGTVSLKGKYLNPSAMIKESFHYWLDAVNQKGGLLGRDVRLILYDDRSDEARTRTLYRKLIEEDRVDLVFSPYGTPLTLAASEVSEQHGMLMLAIAAAANRPWQQGYRYLFQLYAPADRQFIGLLDMMARKNFKTLSVLYDQTSDFHLDVMDGVRGWAQIFNIDIVMGKGYRDGSRELPALLAEARAKGTSGLILSAYSPDCYALLRLLGKMQFKPPVLAMPVATVHPDFQKNIGGMADHIFGPSQWEPHGRIPFPGTRKFIDGFTEFTGHMPSFYAASAYTACQLYAQAITRTQTTDNDKLRDYIAALDTVTVLGRFKVDGAGKQIGHNSFIIQWQEGRKEIVWPQKMQTAPPRF